jgi:c-di-GMP-binding flagellar brake protein YcgR
MIERRKRKRFVERNDVFIRPFFRNGDGLKTKACTYDVSTGGARILTKEPFEVGTLLRIRIELARSGKSVSLEGEVKWRRRNENSGLFEQGVEFLHLTSPKVLALIKHLYCQDEGAQSTAA